MLPHKLWTCSTNPELCVRKGNCCKLNYDHLKHCSTKQNKMVYVCVATGFRSPIFPMADYYRYNTFPQLKSSKLIQSCWHILMKVKKAWNLLSRMEEKKPRLSFLLQQQNKSKKEWNKQKVGEGRGGSYRFTPYPDITINPSWTSGIGTQRKRCVLSCDTVDWSALSCFVWLL